MKEESDSKLNLIQAKQLVFLSDQLKIFGNTIYYSFSGYINKFISEQKLTTYDKKFADAILYALIAMLFSGMEEISKKHLYELADWLGYPKEKEKIISFLGVSHTNYMAYLSSLYLVLLSERKIKLNSDNMLNVFRSVGLESDIRVAAEMISIYNIVKRNDAKQLSALKKQEQSGFGYIYKDLHKMIEMNYYLIQMALDKSMTNPIFKHNFSEKMAPYSYAASLVVFSRKGMNAQDVSNAIKSVGMIPDKNMVDAVLATGFKNSISYIGATYLLVKSKHEFNAENLLELANIFDLHLDKEIADDNIMAFNAVESKVSKI